MYKKSIANTITFSMYTYVYLLNIIFIFIVVSLSSDRIAELKQADLKLKGLFRAFNDKKIYGRLVSDVWNVLSEIGWKHVYGKGKVSMWIPSDKVEESRSKSVYNIDNLCLNRDGFRRDFYE